MCRTKLVPAASFFMTHVLRSGASVRVCQELAWHSTPVLTLGRYAHVRLADLRKTLPTTPTGDTAQREGIRLRATGTEAGAPPAQHLAREIVRGSASVHEGGGALRLAGTSGKRNAGAEISEAPRSRAEPCENEGDGVRTRNHRIDNPVL